MSARSLAGGLVDSMGNPLTGGGVTPFVRDPEGLIAYYRMEDAMAGSTLVDATGLAYTPTTDARITSIAGLVGNAATFAPSGANLALATVTTAATTTFKNRVGYQGLSTSFWFRVNSLPASTVNIRAGYASATPTNQLINQLSVTSAGAVTFNPSFFRNGTAIRNTNFTLLNPVTTGIWYHVCYTYDPLLGSGDNELVYVNNSLISTQVVSRVSNYRNPSGQTVQFDIGCNTTTAVSWSLDEIGVWNRTLTASQVSFLYNGGAGRAYSEITF